MELTKRILNIELPPRQSAFLWGPRKTGKSTLLRSSFPRSIYYDLLETDIAFELTKRPALLREQLSAQSQDRLKEPIVLDEVQKVPGILDEVHWLIENRGLSFLLCGSSARKLKRGQANLLGGRAWRFELFPLVTAESGAVDLLRVLNSGMLPSHYLRKNYRRSLSAYVRDYVKEEIFAEGLTRNVPAFSRFLDAVGYSHGQLTNYANVARDCGVDAKTVKEYYQILVDTLLATRVEPFSRRQSRQVISKAPKYYLFDVGVAGALTRRRITEERGGLYGQAFEHFIFTEIQAHASYSELHYDINFWRTKSGLEVDFVLGGGEIAIEIKGSNRLDRRDLRPLAAFIDEFRPKRAIVVCNESKERLVDGVSMMPWRSFLRSLWEGDVL